MANSPSPLRILVVEDAADTRQNLRDILELDDYQVEVAATARETLRHDDLHTFSASSSTAGG